MRPETALPVQVRPPALSIPVRVVRLETPNPSALSLTRGDFAVVAAAGATHIVDLRGTVPAVVREIWAPSPWRAMDRPWSRWVADLTCTRWTLGDELARRTATLRLPGSPGDEDKLALSRTGRFAVADGAARVLVDLEQGRVVASFEASYGTARPCFDLLPDGREEVLFVAAPVHERGRDRRGVRGDPRRVHGARVDGFLSRHVPAGRARHAPVHVRLRLGVAVRDARIYDARPWTGGAPAGPLAADRGIEPIAANQMLEPDVSAAGEITSASLEQLDEEDLERAHELDPALAERLASLPRASWALIARRLDPSTAAVIGTSVHTRSRRSTKRDVHHADGHRVVLAGPRLLVCDGDQLEDHGPLDLPEGRAHRRGPGRMTSSVVVGQEGVGVTRRSRRPAGPVARGGSLARTHSLHATNGERPRSVARSRTRAGTPPPSAPPAGHGRRVTPLGRGGV